MSDVIRWAIVAALTVWTATLVAYIIQSNPPRKDQP